MPPGPEEIFQHFPQPLGMAKLLFQRLRPALNADAAFAGGGLGLTGAGLVSLGDDSVQSILTTTALERSKAIPLVGNVLSLGATVNYIFGKEGVVNFYNDCLEGKN